MYNAHSYAISIERLIQAPCQAANDIEKQPLEYIKGFLDKIYEQSPEKANLIDIFDEKYGKYKNMHLLNWKEEDTAQMVKDLRDIMF